MKLGMLETIECTLGLRDGWLVINDISTLIHTEVCPELAHSSVLPEGHFARRTHKASSISRARFKKFHGLTELRHWRQPASACMGECTDGLSHGILCVDTTSRGLTVKFVESQMDG